MAIRVRKAYMKGEGGKHKLLANLFPYGRPVLSILKPRGLPIPDWTLKMLFDGHHHSVVFPSLLSPWPDTEFHCRRVIVHL